MDAGDRYRVGRRRRQTSNAPPVWFGLPFAGAGTLVMVLSLTVPDAPTLVMLPFGLLFFAAGVGLVWTSLRARAAEQPKSRINVGQLDVERFSRSPMQVFVDFIAAPLGGVGFLVAAVISLPTIIGPIMFGFFGILMLRGAAVTIRRGITTTIATVGPDGIWTPELGQLAWAEAAEIRVEDMRGIGGPDNSAVVGYRRLGIVPRSAQLIEDAPGRGAMAMARGFMSFVNTIRPGAGLSDPSRLAPYGINASELEQPFAELVRSVQRFAPVANAEIALGDGTRDVHDSPARPNAGPAAIPAAPSLFEGLGMPAESFAGTSVLSGTPFVTPEQAPAAAAEARTFLRSGGPVGTFGSIAEISTVLPWLLLPGLILVGFPAVMLFSPNAQLSPMLIVALAFLLIPLGFVAYGVSLLLDMPARWRMRSGPPELMTVNMDGIELRGMGRLSWSEIEDVRVVDSNRPTSEGSPNIPRLEIVPRDRSRLAGRSVWDRRRDAWRSFLRRLNPFGDRRPVEPCYAIDLDLLDSPSNDVIDLIARYRVVDDRF